MTVTKLPFDALNKPMTPSAELAAIIGSKPMPRAEVTRKLWEYVQTHNLQDNKNKRIINADAKLKLIFDDRSRVSMFEITKLIDPHLWST